MNDDLLADLKEWAESYEAVESGADGVLYAAINRIEKLNKRNKELEAALREITESARLVGDYHHVNIARAALGEKKNEI
jgi:uncharacterized protein (UPF0335 family)